MEKLYEILLVFIEFLAKTLERTNPFFRNLNLKHNRMIIVYFFLFQHKGMNLPWTYAILSFLVFANAFSADEFAKFISLTKYSYEEFCSKSADLEWAFVTKPTNRTRRLWVRLYPICHAIGSAETAKVLIPGTRSNVRCRKQRRSSMPGTR